MPRSQPSGTDKPASASRVYIAADFGRAGDAEALARRGRDAGMDVVSSWHAAVNPLEAANATRIGGPPEDAARAAAVRNLTELDAAETVLVLTTGELARGGRHFETGYAYARGKRIVLVGVVEHAFHRLDGIETAANGDVALALMLRGRPEE